MAVNCADACRHTPTLNTGFLPCVLLPPIARSLSLADKSEFKLPWSHSDPPRILEKISSSSPFWVRPLIPHNRGVFGVSHGVLALWGLGW